MRPAPLFLTRRNLSEPCESPEQPGHCDTDGDDYLTRRGQYSEGKNESQEKDLESKKND